MDYMFANPAENYKEIVQEYTREAELESERLARIEIAKKKGEEPDPIDLAGPSSASINANEKFEDLQESLDADMRQLEEGASRKMNMQHRLTFLRIMQEKFGDLGGPSEGVCRDLILDVSTHLIAPIHISTNQLLSTSFTPKTFTRVFLLVPVSGAIHSKTGGLNCQAET